MVDLVHHLAIHDVLELREIDHVARLGGDLTLHRHVELVVVPMPVGIVALPEQLGVFGVAQRGIVHAMRGVEVQSAGDGDVRHTGPSKEEKPRGFPHGAFKIGSEDGFAKPIRKLRHSPHIPPSPALRA
jgi:hypothetical protein